MNRSATVPCPDCERLNRVDLARHDHATCGSCGEPLDLHRPIHLADHNLEAVIRDTEAPVLVDFYADWCAPCKMMAPVIEALAAERAGSVLVAKLDTDRNPTMAVRFGIRGIPSLLVFRHGREVARETGAVSADRLAALIEHAAAV